MKELSLMSLSRLRLKDGIPLRVDFGMPFTLFWMFVLSIHLRKKRSLHVIESLIHSIA